MPYPIKVYLKTNLLEPIIIAPHFCIIIKQRIRG